MKTPVGLILRTKPPLIYAIDRDRSVLEAARLMSDHDIGSLIALDSGEPWGLLTLRHIVNRVLTPGLDPGTTRVSEVTPAGLAPIRPTATVEEAMAEMAQRNCRYLLVCEDHGALVGIVSRGDLTRWLLRDQEHHITDLMNFIRSA